MEGYRMDRTLLTSKDMQMILAGLRSLDSVSGSSYYGQLMEKLKPGSSDFISGRDSVLIDLSSWSKESLAPKISLIQDAVEERRQITFYYYAANVKHFFTLLGKMFFTPYGKEFFTYLGKQIFIS